MTRFSPAFPRPCGPAISSRRSGDVADLAWEAARLRRLKADVLTAAAPEGLERVLAPLIVDAASRRLLVDRWAAREPAAIEEVDALLASAGLGIDAVMAAALALELDAVERIDRMIGNAEARRNAVLRDVDRARAAFARDLRRAAREAEKRELDAVAPRLMESGEAA